jgi:antirestriction protein ArdC
MRTNTVHYGSLAVPLSGQRHVDAAFAYLARDPAARAVIERAERCRTPHRIVIDHHGRDAYRPSARAIVWDPHSAMRVGNGRQSPALGLVHELAHALARPQAFDRLVNREVPRYDNAEERRVIAGAERHAARTLHEAVRHDHRGTLYRVRDATMR